MSLKLNFTSCLTNQNYKWMAIIDNKYLQAPYLEDPNTGVQMFESAEIVEYLKATYAK